MSITSGLSGCCSSWCKSLALTESCGFFRFSINFGHERIVLIRSLVALSAGRSVIGKVPHNRRCVLEDIIRKNNDHQVAWLVRNHPQSACQGHAGTGSGDDAFFANQAKAHIVGVPVRDFRFSVVFLRVVQFGLLQLSLTPYTGNVMAFLGVDAEDLDAAILFLQKSSCSGNGPTSPQAGHEMGHAPARLPPDLRARRTVVGARIGLIGILIQQLVIWVGLGLILSPRDRPLRAHRVPDKASRPARPHRCRRTAARSAFRAESPSRAEFAGRSRAGWRS